MKPLHYAANKVITGTRNVGNKLNPLDKPINKNDTADTGFESLKLGYRTAKKGKKTVRGVELLYKAPVNTVKVAVGTIKVSGTIIAHIAAFLLSPVFWILVFILLVVSTLIVPLILILAGGGIAGTTKSKAYGTAAGSNQNITTAFVQAEDFYRIASENKQNEFNSLIDSLYYNSNDLSHSDLVYLKCSHDGAEYQTSLATDHRKQQLKDKFSNSLPKAEAIALVYVYLEKQKNDDNNTSGEIYEVEFTQQGFDDLLNQMISWHKTIYNNQRCPDENCSIHQEQVPNPEHQDKQDKSNKAANAYNDWGYITDFFDIWVTIQDGNAQSMYWNNEIGWRIDEWKQKYDSFVPYYVDLSNNGYDFLQKLGNWYVDCVNALNNTPEYITKTTVTCDNQHKLTAIRLDILSKEAVMDSWGFDENYKQWVEMTYQFFVNNPDIQTN